VNAGRQGAALRLARRVADVLDWIDQLGAYLAALALSVMSGIVVLEVLLRFFLTQSTLIADEIAAYMLAAMSFCALGYALRTEAHLRIQLVFERLSPALRRRFEIAFVLIGIGSMTVFTWWLYRMVVQSFVLKVDSQSQIETPLWIPQSALVLGSAILILALVSRLLRLLTHELQP
jgi:TRAP-type C4-dicarboxylate transport system permease small subunit